MPSNLLALHLQFGALLVAVLLVRVVSAVIGTVANRRRRRAVVVLALEGAVSALPWRARFWFVGTIFAVFFAVTSLKVNGNS